MQNKVVCTNIKVYIHLVISSALIIFHIPLKLQFICSLYFFSCCHYFAILYQFVCRPLTYFAHNIIVVVTFM